MTVAWCMATQIGYCIDFLPFTMPVQFVSRMCWLRLVSVGIANLFVKLSDFSGRNRILLAVLQLCCTAY